MRGEERPGFADFVAARSAALYRTAYLLTGDREDAADLVQTALERACRHWRKIARTQSPEAYVRTILANQVRDGWRRRRRRPEVPLGPQHERNDDDRQTDRVDLRDQLVKGLTTLPAGMRAVLVLRYFDELTDAEIGNALGISPASVRSQASRGLARLRTAVVGDDHDGAVTRLPFGGAA